MIAEIGTRNCLAILVNVSPGLTRYVASAAVVVVVAVLDVVAAEASRGGRALLCFEAPQPATSVAHVATAVTPCIQVDTPTLCRGGVAVGPRPPSQHSIVGGKQAPCSGHALELVFATIGEGESGAGEQVVHGARYDDLAGAGSGCHTGADVHGEAADALAAHLDLTRVHTRPHFDPDPSQRIT